MLALLNGYKKFTHLVIYLEPVAGKQAPSPPASQEGAAGTEATKRPPAFRDALQRLRRPGSAGAPLAASSQPPPPPPLSPPVMQISVAAAHPRDNDAEGTQPAASSRAAGVGNLQARDNSPGAAAATAAERPAPIAPAAAGHPEVSYGLAAPEAPMAEKARADHAAAQPLQYQPLAAQGHAQASAADADTAAQVAGDVQAGAAAAANPGLLVLADKRTAGAVKQGGWHLSCVPRASALACSFPRILSSAPDSSRQQHLWPLGKDTWYCCPLKFYG